MRYEVGQFRSYAEEDRNQLEVNALDGYSAANSTCVHAQQYVEKMLKEKIVEFGGNPPRIHDLLDLYNELEQLTGVQAPEDVVICILTLGEYYLDYRYPGKHSLKATPEMAETAYEYATTVVNWLERLIPDKRPGGSVGSFNWNIRTTRRSLRWFRRRSP